MALKFSMILEAVDRASAPARRAQSTIARLTAGVRRWGQDVRRVSRDIEGGSRSVEHYERRARRLRQVALGTFFRAASEQARRFNSSLRTGIRNLDLMGRAGRGAKAGLGWLGGKALGAAKWGGAAAGALASYSLFDMFKTGGQFEQYQVMLEGTEGSLGKAKSAMAWVQKFAQDTPYELDQVMEAFIGLKSYGIDPMNGSLQSLGDGASGMSKDIGQAVEALADAITGEYERLKEFGIRASKAGDQVTFTYRKNGKDIQRTVKATGNEIEKAVTGIFSDRFGGGMARQSKTLFGILSNLKDMWNGFLLRVADAGIFDRVKTKLEEWQARLNTMSQDGRMRDWAQAISDRLSEAFDWAVKFVEQTDWAAVGRGLATGLTALVRIVELLGQAVNKFQQFQAYRAANQAETVEKGWFTSAKDRAEAASRRRRIESQFGVQTDSGRKEAEAAAGAVDRRLGDDVNRIRWKRGLTKHPISATGGWSRLPSGTSKLSAAAPAAQVGGALDINVKVQGPAVASVGRVTSVNRAVPINAKVGKVMGAPA